MMGDRSQNSNFDSLSQLGQSDKKPQESIGSKGIGFRSVLEVSLEPKIYSRGVGDSYNFDGFCFTFSPAAIRNLIDPVLALWSGVDNAASPFSDAPLVDWDASLITKFRDKVAEVAHRARLTPKDWLKQELSYLSPYLLPIPSDRRSEEASVQDFELRGFATLICLPIKSSAALALVRQKVEDVDDGALLFLEKASSLVLDAGVRRRDLLRDKKLFSGGRSSREITIAQKGSDSVRKYWVWTSEITLSDQDERVRNAVQQLPGKWPQLQKAAVSIAVRLGKEPELGVLSIFLPTLLGTGCATHISAPFFGDMSRTHVDFGASDNESSSSGAIYNRFLLSEAARLAISIVRNELAGHGPDEARAIVDLLAPLTTDHGATELWQQLTKAAAKEAGVNILTAEWFLSDCGWKAINEIALLPVKNSPSIMTPEMLRKHAAFAAVVEEMEPRRELIEALSNAQQIDAYPTVDDLARTVESIAGDLQDNSGADWNGFWSDVGDLFKNDCSALVGKRSCSEMTVNFI